MAHFASTSAADSDPIVAGRRWRDVKAMVLLWALFGVLVGAGTSPAHGGVIGVISGMLAGVIVLPVLGAALGLFGCRAKTAFIGGACGAILCSVAALTAARAGALQAACFGLVSGAVVGATVGPVLNLYRRLLVFAARTAIGKSNGIAS